jgi:WW domain-containing oxidoreductase
VHLVRCDLLSLEATERTARDLASKLTSLDGLICNAGIGVGPYNLSSDGIESHMQINVISQHLLTRHLLPLLIRTPDSRLVYESSEFHRLGVSDIEFKDIAELNTDIGASKLYARSKLAQVLLVECFSRRKAASQLGLSPGHAPWINAVHPGAVSTDQPEQAIDAYGTVGKLGVKAARLVMKEPVDEGCRPALFAATSADVAKDGVDGKYIVPDRKVTDTGKQAGREELQERCWALVEGLLKEKLGEVGY